MLAKENRVDRDCGGKHFRSLVRFFSTNWTAACRKDDVSMTARLAASRAATNDGRAMYCLLRIDDRFGHDGLGACNSCRLELCALAPLQDQANVIGVGIDLRWVRVSRG